LAACGDTPFATPTPLPHTTTGSAIDLNQLDCPSPTVKAIVTAIRVTIGRPSDLNALEIVCLGRESGRDVILQIKTVYQQPQNAPGLLMIGPDSAGSLAQLQASSTSTGGFTSVSGVGDNAASFIETVSGRRAVTLYVQRGGTEFHISMEFALPDSVLQRDERTLALALLPQIRSAPVPGRASVNPQDLGAFYAGDYAASLVTPAEIAAVLGRPVLPLRSNGGRASYQPGIGVSNATSLAKDGSITFELQVYRGTSAAVARAFLTGFWEVPTTTPNPALAGLGDAAFLDVTGNRLVVLSGRELASISVGGPTMPRDTSLVMEKALAAILVPRLLH
jgi:hypothetical protein